MSIDYLNILPYHLVLMFRVLTLIIFIYQYLSILINKHNETFRYFIPN